MKHQRAFTLIETIIYLALFGILMGGAVVSAAHLFESSTRSQTITILENEGNYLMGKIQWALYGAQAVTTPAAGGGVGTILTTTKWDTSVGNPIQIGLTGSTLTLSRAGGTAVVLNNTNTSVTSVQFVHTAGSADGTTPESVAATLTLTARTPNGMVIARTFSATTYVRH